MTIMMGEGAAGNMGHERKEMGETKSAGEMQLPEFK